MLRCTFFSAKFCHDPQFYFYCDRFLEVDVLDEQVFLLKFCKLYIAFTKDDVSFDSQEQLWKHLCYSTLANINIDFLGWQAKMYVWLFLFVSFSLLGWCFLKKYVHVCVVYMPFVLHLLGTVFSFLTTTGALFFWLNNNQII